MPKQAFIHIGFDKTGTSAIQHYLATHRRQVRRKTGFSYSDIGRERHQHIGIARAAGFGFRGMDDFAGRERCAEALKAAGRRDRSPDLLISSEYFSYGQRPERFAVLKDLFAGFETRIIVYVRTLPSWLRSLYSETVKAGFPGGFEAFIQQQRRRIDYAAVLDQWAATFGPDRLTVKIYEQEKDALILSFLRILRPDISLTIRPRQVNPSLTPYDIVILQRANALLGHEGPADACRLHEFYLAVKARQPESWPGPRREGSIAFAADKADELMRLSERFAARYLPQDRASFIAQTEADLAKAAPSPLPKAETERLSFNLAESYRNQRRSHPVLVLLRRRLRLPHLPA